MRLLSSSLLVAFIAHAQCSALTPIRYNANSHRRAPPVHLELSIPTQLLASGGLPKYASSVRSFPVPPLPSSSTQPSSSSSAFHNNNSTYTSLYVVLNTAHKDVGEHLDNLFLSMRHPDPLRRKPRSHLDNSDKERRERGRFSDELPWVKPEEPEIPATRVPPAAASSKYRHHPRTRKEEEEEEEEAHWAQREYEDKLQEVQAWHTPLTLPPFLPILYSDYIIEEQRTIWRYDAKDRHWRDDQEARNAWATLRVRTVAERREVGPGRGMDDHEGAKVDERNLKILVKNLAERGAVRACQFPLENHCHTNAFFF